MDLSRVTFGRISVGLTSLALDGAPGAAPRFKRGSLAAEGDASLTNDGDHLVLRCGCRLRWNCKRRQAQRFGVLGEPHREFADSRLVNKHGIRAQTQI
ncbi:protein of unknown function (plasmid) [Methylocella tundrae]|uniref:Uncharacterized protein n=1 Tax=Methylocella tundrae TaxID=227605 RepID=A0A4U8Z7G2_METTU|nr:protein of unknown function [Methylocella tundrae]